MSIHTTLFRIVNVVGLLAALGGCGSGSDDQIATYQDQKVVWETCDAQRLSPEDAKFARQIDSRVVCADIRVPMDYANPAQGEIKVAVMRVKGSNNRDDNPAILLNTGGPGNDGWSYALSTARVWALNETTEDPTVVQAYQQLAQQYDLVGFSPRGIGWSTQLICPRTQEPFSVADPTRQLDAANMANTLRNSQLIAQSCENQALMPFINTDATARDMDLIRHLLRQDKLNFIGLSYGTWLGNWYASLFPERVGRMLLTGVTNFGIPLSHQNLIEDSVRQKVFDENIIPYAVGAQNQFGFKPAVTVFSLRMLIDGLSDQLHAALVNEYIDRSLLSNTQNLNDAVHTLRAAQVLDATLKRGNPSNEANLTAALDAEFGELVATPETFKQKARSNAEFLLKRYLKPASSDDSMYWSVVCNDSGTDYTPETWIAEGNENARRYPDFGGAIRENACLYWRKPTVARPIQQRAAQAGQIVMLQSTRDPLTILSGAMNSLSLLPNASMVLINDEITHAPVPPYGTTCVDRPIADYFLHGTPPPRMTTCTAR